MSRIAIALLAGIGITAGASQAYAQSSTTAAANNSDANGGAIPEIIVTAEKRNDKLLTLPNAISVYQGDQLAQSGVTGVGTLKQVSPSIVWTDSAAEPHLAIRGIGNDLINIGGESGVTIARDWVPLASPLMSRRDFLDTGNIEVLRGPQGTVSGRNSPGGAINLYSNAPTDTAEGDVSLGYGNFNRKQLSAVLSGPIVGDKLLGRIAVSYVKDDGWLYDTTTNQWGNSQDNIHYRGYLTYKPSDAFKVSLIVDGFDNKGFDLAGVDAGRVQPNIQSLSEYYLGHSSFDIKNLTFQQDTPGPFTGYGQQYTLRAEWNLGGTSKLTSTTGYQKFHQEGYRDYDAIPLAIEPSYLLEDIKQISQELTYTTDIGDRADLIVGGLFLKQIAHEPFGLGSETLPVGAIQFYTRQEVKSYAVYTQFRYKLTDKLRITLGTRETFDKKVYDQTLDILGTQSVSPTLRGSWNAFTPRIALDYTPTSSLTFYVNVSKGYTSGGFNTFSGEKFNPEFVTSYEVGLKSYLLDHHLRFNLSAFHSDFRDIQTTLFVPTSGGVAASLSVTNAGGAKIDGVEAELEANVGGGLHITANGSWTNARYTKLQSVDGSVPEDGVLDLAGNKMPRVPKWQTNIGANYTVPVSDNWNAELVANYTWQSKIYFDFFNHALMTQGAYGLLNLSASLNSADKDWSISVFANNATNKRYWSNKQWGTGLAKPYANGMIGEPRTYGVKLERRF